MRRLMLLRHAKTENDAPSGQDQDRRLDDRGRLDAAAVGGWIGRHPPLPDTVLVSTAVRTLQTWEIAREAMRDAGKPLAAGEIAACIIAAKRFPDAAHLAVTKMIVVRLGVLAGRGEIAKTGKTRDARWAVKMA